MGQKIAVVAVGGNALITDKSKSSIPDQYDAASKTMSYIVDMIAEGWKVVITHGNGPQVGFILRRSELAASELHEVPLEYCGADTQGAIGYMFQQSLHNEFKKRAMSNNAVTVVSQCLVDRDDPAFITPTKPIGSFLDKETAEKRMSQGKTFIEDSGRGWREVVASPIPQEIIEAPAIQALIDGGLTVIAVGGGGIPVIENEDGHLKGRAAVIDKDFASGLLANNLGAELLLISTAVEKVSLNLNTPEQQDLGQMTVAEAETYIDEGHFAPGSMLPKIQAIIKFLKEGGKQALITDPQNIKRALAGETGTWVIP